MSKKKIEETVIENAPCCGKDECETCPYDVETVLETVVTPVEAPKSAKTVIARDGDSYASIAASHKPVGSSRHEYATVLFEKNNGKRLSAGVEVVL